MDRWLRAMIFSACLLLPVTAFTQDSDFIRGDVNADGNFNGLVDGIFLLNFQFVPGSPAPPCLDAADVDDDGSINALVEAIYIFTLQFG